jgi:WD40 repeat protein
MFLRALLCVMLSVMVGCQSSASNFPVVREIQIDDQYPTIWSLDWNNEQNLIALGGHMTTQLYDFDQNIMHPLKDEVGVINSVSWGKNGDVLAGATDTVWVREAEGIKNISSLEPYHNYAHVSWNATSSYISAVYIDQNLETMQLNIWKFDDRTLFKTFDNIGSYSWGQNNVLATAPYKGNTVSVMDDFRTSQPVELFSFKDSVTSLSWNPSGTYLAGTSLAGEIIVWDIASGREILSLDHLADLTHTIKWHETKDIISVASEEGSRLICISTGLVTSVETSASQDTAWQPEQSLLATAQKKSLLIFDVSQFVEDCK